MIKSFGRNPTESAAAPVKGSRVAPSTPGEGPAITVTGDGDADADARAKVDPPIQRFLDTEHASDLKVGDVSVLLEDYKRLASAIFKQTS